MKLTKYFLLLLLNIVSIDSSIYTNSRNDLAPYLDKQTPREDETLQHDLEEDGLDVEDTSDKLVTTNADYQVNIATKNPEKKVPFFATNNMKYNGDEQQLNDVERAQKKAAIVMRSRARDDNVQLNIPELIPAFEEDNKEHFRVDPVMNELGRLRRLYRKVGRRSGKKKKKVESENSQSSSREFRDWKEEFKEQWLQKKFEALNKSVPNRGDQVNMVAARPWGVPCGDPNQHDMPWGTCMLSMECESEYRIYRGDLFCGRTRYVCCALQLTGYDMYQGFDVSLDDKSLSTDSEEKKTKKTSAEKKKKKKRHDSEKRKKNRSKRKRKMKKTIKRIIKEIRKILNRQYKNGTKQRKKKTDLLKKFVKKLKKQYKKDRMSIQDLHEEEMIKIDAALMAKLNHISELNKQFMNNETFRNAILNGTITKTGARMLIEAYPELKGDIKLRRSGGGDVADEGLDKQYFEYDIEYGYLYE